MTTSQCQVFKVADVLGKKWTLPLLQQIALNGHQGFNELMRQMRKMSPKIMAQRLKELERLSVIQKKTREEQTALKTAYTLTEKGKELQQLLHQLKVWNEKHVPASQGCAERECVTCEHY